MPKIYEYFGIVFLFYSKDHDPIHIHAQYGDYENKYDLIVKNGKVVDVIKRRVKGSKELPASQAKQAMDLVNAKKESMVKKYEQIFVENRKVDLVKITRKL